MKDEHFQELLTSVRQMGDFLKGKKVAGVKISRRPKPATAKEVKEVRTRLGVTQEVFARMVGEGVGAVRTWEQGIRNPGGAATKLIRYVMQHPKVAKELLAA
jgi:putative transcriptional regulator